MYIFNPELYNVAFVNFSKCFPNNLSSLILEAL